THLAKQRQRHRYRARGIALRMGPLLWSMKIAGLSHRQQAEALNAKEVPVPSQWTGELGDTVYRARPGPRCLWNKTQVQRIWKHLEIVRTKIRWWRKWTDKQLVGAEKLTEAQWAQLLKDVEREDRKILVGVRNQNRIDALRKREAYRAKVRGE